MHVYGLLRSYTSQLKLYLAISSMSINECIHNHDYVGTTVHVLSGYKCVCSGENLIYNCSVHDNAHGATVWNGTAFSGCEILLPHRHFTPTGDPIGTCNNGDIVEQSLGVQGNNYTSQLNVTITLGIAGKTITCAYDALTTDPTNDMIHFSTIVPGTHKIILH